MQNTSLPLASKWNFDPRRLVNKFVGRIMNPYIPTPNATADEVGVMVGDAEIVDGGNCFGRADLSNLY